MEKSIEQKIKDNIRIGLEIIKNTNMGLLKNGYKATWDKSGKFKVENEQNKIVERCDIKKAIDIIYKGGKA